MSAFVRCRKSSIFARFVRMVLQLPKYTILCAKNPSKTSAISRTSRGPARSVFYSVCRERQCIKSYTFGSVRTCIAADIRRTLPACCTCGKCILFLRHPAICRALDARFVCTAGSFSNFPPNNRYSGVVASSYPYLFKDFVKPG